jgi:hypothetical protein
VTGSEHGPGQPPVGDQQKVQRRDEIIAAAKKVFARNGFQTWLVLVERVVCGPNPMCSTESRTTSTACSRP